MPSVPQQQRRRTNDDTSLDVAEALNVLRNLAIAGAAVGCVLFAVSNANMVRDAVTGIIASVQFAPVALNLVDDDVYQGGHSGSSSSSGGGSGSGSGSYRRLFGRGLRAHDDNHSGSLSDIASEAPEPNPVAAIFVSGFIALVALGVARWPSERRARPISRPLGKLRAVH